MHTEIIKKNSEAYKVTESESHASIQTVSAYFRRLAYMFDYTTSVFFPSCCSMQLLLPLKNHWE